MIDEQQRMYLVKTLLKDVVDFTACHDRFWGDEKILGKVTMQMRPSARIPDAYIYVLENGRCQVEHLKPRPNKTKEHRIKEKISRIDKVINKFYDNY